MDKRYQVFVSSTYTDLIEERQTVMQTLMEMDCIPAGMELFPAADEDQFEFIKRVIDDCDYYILIIGGRYGSLAEDRLSYTEKEYDYAVEKGKKIIALLHKSPGKIPAEKTEASNELREKLNLFREKASTGRLVDFWEDAKDLRGSVSVSLNKTIKMFPAIGWVRGDKVASNEILEEINELRKKNQTLEQQLIVLNDASKLEIQNLVSFDAEYEIELRYEIGQRKTNSYDWEKEYNNRKKISKILKLTWNDIFMLLAKYFSYEKSESIMQSALANFLALNLEIEKGYELISYRIASTQFKQILTQLMAYGLTKSYPAQNKRYLNWSLTEKGKKCMLENQAILKE